MKQQHWQLACPRPEGVYYQPHGEGYAGNTPGIARCGLEEEWAADALLKDLMKLLLICVAGRGRNTPISGVAIDSRKVQAEICSIPLADGGHEHDGHHAEEVGDAGRQGPGRRTGC